MDTNGNKQQKPSEEASITDVTFETRNENIENVPSKSHRKKKKTKEKHRKREPATLENDETGNALRNEEGPDFNNVANDLDSGKNGVSSTPASITPREGISPDEKLSKEVLLPKINSDETASTESISFLEDEKNEKPKRYRPITLGFKDIELEITERKGFKKISKVILKRISGYCKPGMTLAIMGSSGAGKTSLLNVLAGRTDGIVRGDIFVNGRKLTENHRKFFKHISGYVMQDDVLLSNLTVRETLMFSALMRIPNSVPKEEKIKRVDEAIRELGLRKSVDTIIGDVNKRGISGGERKRVNIAIELITDPSLLFLDEPTSGLDSYTAVNIMETLRSVANNGRTVIFTIHQPRSNIFALFDMLMLLCEGQLVYFGPAKYAVEYFSQLNFVCPQYSNPADYLLDIASIDIRTEAKSKKTNETIDFLIRSYPESKLSKEQFSLIEQQGNEEEMPSSVRYANNTITQCSLLLGRSAKNFYRNKVLNVIRLIQTLFFAVIIGLLYLRIGNNQTSITDRAGALFFILVNQSFSTIFSVLNQFPVEKAVFMRERASKMYRVLPYYLMKSIVELPGQIFFPILTSVIIYWMIGLNPIVSHFFIFVLIIVLASLSAISLGICISAASPSVDVANTIAPVALVVFMLFGGYFLNGVNIPNYFIWIEYLSFLKYSFSALMQNEFDGLTFTCTQSQLVRGSNGEALCPLTTGSQVLILYGMENDIGIWPNVFVLLALIVGFRTLGYVFLRIFTKPKTA